MGPWLNCGGQPDCCLNLLSIHQSERLVWEKHCVSYRLRGSGAGKVLAPIVSSDNRNWVLDGMDKMETRDARDDATLEMSLATERSTSHT